MKSLTTYALAHCWHLLAIAHRRESAVFRPPTSVSLVTCCCPCDHSAVLLDASESSKMPSWLLWTVACVTVKAASQRGVVLQCVLDGSDLLSVASQRCLLPGCSGWLLLKQQSRAMPFKRASSSWRGCKHSSVVLATAVLRSAARGSRLGDSQFEFCHQLAALPAGQNLAPGQKNHGWLGRSVALLFAPSSSTQLAGTLTEWEAGGPVASWAQLPKSRSAVAAAGTAAQRHGCSWNSSAAAASQQRLLWQLSFQVGLTEEEQTK